MRASKKTLTEISGLLRKWDPDILVNVVNTTEGYALTVEGEWNVQYIPRMSDMWSAAWIVWGWDTLRRLYRRPIGMYSCSGGQWHVVNPLKVHPPLGIGKSRGEAILWALRTVLQNGGNQCK